MKRIALLLPVCIVLSAHAAPPAPAPASAVPDTAAMTPAARADVTFRAWDANHDGNLTPDEFRAGWVALATRQAVQAKLRAQFAKLDANRDGALDGTEYAGIALAHHAGAAAPLSRFDTNRDGRLGFAEYVGLVAALAPRPAAADAPVAGR